MDRRRYDSMDGIGRVASGTKTENNVGAIVENCVGNDNRGRMQGATSALGDALISKM